MIFESRNWSGATLCETLYGFQFGPAFVERLISTDEGGVVIAISNAPVGDPKRKSVEVYVSPTGRVVRVENLIGGAKCR